MNEEWQITSFREKATVAIMRTARSTGSLLDLLWTSGVAVVSLGGDGEGSTDVFLTSLAGYGCGAYLPNIAKRILLVAFRNIWAIAIAAIAHTAGANTITNRFMTHEK